MGDPDANARAAALKRLEDRRGFEQDIIAYVIVNVALVVIWWVSGHQYFWPAWIIGGWGIGVIFHALAVFRRPITEADIRREMERHRGGTA